MYVYMCIRYMHGMLNMCSDRLAAFGSYECT